MKSWSELHSFLLFSFFRQHLLVKLAHSKQHVFKVYILITFDTYTPLKALIKITTMTFKNQMTSNTITCRLYCPKTFCRTSPRKGNKTNRITKMWAWKKKKISVSWSSDSVKFHTKLFLEGHFNFPRLPVIT